MVTRVVLALTVGLVMVAFGTVAAGAGEGAPPGGADISPIPTSWEQLGGDLAIWTAVVFLVLLLVLWKLAWRPIVDGLARRERRIADEIASAERTNAEARKLLDEYRQRLTGSGGEIQQMIEAARRDAEKAGHEIIEKARADAKLEHQRMLGQLELAATNALKDLAEKSATLAVQLAGKVVESKLDPQAHSHLIEQAVADFSKQQRGKDLPPDGGADGPGP